MLNSMARKIVVIKYTTAKKLPHTHSCIFLSLFYSVYTFQLYYEGKQETCLQGICEKSQNNMMARTKSVQKHTAPNELLLS